jgi:hypothetical protein
LQHTDDTIIMLQLEDLDIANLKFLLLCFESMPGSVLISTRVRSWFWGTTDLESQRIANMLSCKRGSFPFTYLGLPISDWALSTRD